MRSQFHAVLKHIVAARIEIDGLKQIILFEVSAGRPPTYRGKDLTKAQYDALVDMSNAVEAAFAFAKGVQFVETLEQRSLEGQRLLGE